MVELKTADKKQVKKSLTKATSSNVRTIVTISLIGHLSNIMLRAFLNRLKAKAEELLAQEQADFRSGRSTVEQNDLRHLSHHREATTTPVRSVLQLHRLQEGI